MARVAGVKEKVHLPIYDAFFVQATGQVTGKNKFVDFMTDRRVIRFFVDVQNKTRLETNLQAAGVLPSMNSFEARAMRVVVSTPPLEDPEQKGLMLAELIYSSVTTLLVGEKVMIEMPTFWFPGGAGVNLGNGAVTNHGEPDPMATFRFAEPVFIEPNQNFRVEMLFPHDVPERVANAQGPLRVWAVLDGYLTRDVQ